MKIKFAVVGCGHIGMRHAEMITRNPEAELAAMCDINEEKEVDCRKYKVPFFTDFNEMIANISDVDVVCICTPNGLHSNHSLIALNAGKHVVCEKPMGLSTAKCEEVIHKALQKSKHFFCVMQNRYSPPSVWLKEIIEQNTLGEIYMVQINCYWNRDERYYKKDGWKGKESLDGGTLFTQFSHFIDLMYWLFGDIKNINGKFADFNHQHLTDFEDSGFINFEFVNGGIGNLNYSTSVWNQNFESSMIVIGEKGTLKVGGQYMNEVSYCHIENYEMPQLAEASPANDYGSYKGSAANHHFIIANVVDTLKNRTSATTNALEGLKVVDIIERIYSVRDKKYDLSEITRQRQ